MSKTSEILENVDGWFKGLNKVQKRKVTPGSKTAPMPWWNTLATMDKVHVYENFSAQDGFPEYTIARTNPKKKGKK